MAARWATLRARWHGWLLDQWFQPQPTPWARIAGPLATLAGALSLRDRSRQLRLAAASAPLRAPVVVVGNLVVGGAGKTPTTIALVHALRAAGWCPGIVSRGHGRRGDGAVEVDSQADPRSAGDEPLLMARRTGAAVAVGRDRLAAAGLLLARHPRIDVIVADDGRQHRRLPRALDVVVFDSRGCGNGRMLPAGPLREPWTERPDPGTLVLYTEGAVSTAWPGHVARRRITGAWRHEHWCQTERPAPMPLTELRGRRLFAPAGMAVPERFFAALREAGLDIEPCPLPDHHDYARCPWPPQVREVITTEKDAVKLGRWAGHGVVIWVVGLDLELPAPFVAEMLTRLAPLRPT